MYASGLRPTSTGEWSDDGRGWILVVTHLNGCPFRAIASPKHDGYYYDPRDHDLLEAIKAEAALNRG